MASVGGGEQLARVGVLRVVKKLLHRVFLHDAPAFHHHHMVAELIDHVEVVRDEENEMPSSSRTVRISSKIWR